MMGTKMEANPTSTAATSSAEQQMANPRFPAEKRVAKRPGLADPGIKTAKSPTADAKHSMDSVFLKPPVQNAQGTPTPPSTVSSPDTGSGSFLLNGSIGRRKGIQPWRSDPPAAFDLELSTPNSNTSHNQATTADTDCTAIVKPTSTATAPPTQGGPLRPTRFPAASRATCTADKTLSVLLRG